MTTQVCSIGEYVRAMTKNPMLADKLKGSEDKFSKDEDGGGGCEDMRFLFFYLSKTNYL